MPSTTAYVSSPDPVFHDHPLEKLTKPPATKKTKHVTHRQKEGPVKPMISAFPVARLALPMEPPNFRIPSPSPPTSTVMGIYFCFSCPARVHQPFVPVADIYNK